MEDHEKVKTAQEYHKIARELRGRILNDVAVMDTLMAEILTEYFCRNSLQKDLFFSEIATSPWFGLKSKFDLIRKILERDFDFYLKKYPKIGNDVKKIREFRNRLAHATIDVSDEALKETKIKGVGFVIYKDGKKRVDLVTFEKSEDYAVKINMVLGNLSDILRLVKL